jgi:hypothetical protein
MKKLLVTTALLALSVPALADTIVATARVDGTLEQTATSINGVLSLNGAIPGGIFTLNQLSADSQSVLPAPGILTTNTLNLQQTATGSHTLVIDVIASGLTGPNALRALLSSFSVSGLTAGWDAREQTFINGNLLADTGVFTTPSASVFSTNLALGTNPFSAEVRYTIDSVGIGGFNGGIDISAPVPGPVVGAGLPGLAAGALTLFGIYRRKRSAVEV